VNYCSFIGNLTDDPKLRKTDQGTPVANFSVAVNKPGKRDDRDEPLYMDVQCWEKLAESVDEYLAKGRKVFVSGELQMQRWRDKETDEKRTKYVLNARVVEFLDKPDTDDDRGRGRDRDERGRDSGRDSRERGRDSGRDNSRGRGRDDDRGYDKDDPGPDDRGSRNSGRGNDPF